MDYMSLVPMAPGPHTSEPHPNHKKYPYLLRRLSITRPNQVWAIDITCIRLAHGFVYMTAVTDWFSRYVVTWELSPTLDNEFRVHWAEETFRSGYNAIFWTVESMSRTFDFGQSCVPVKDTPYSSCLHRLVVSGT